MSTARKIITDAGLEYIGEQGRRTGAPGHMFNARTGSTLMLTEVTRETLAAKLAQHYDEFDQGVIANLAKIIKGQREEADLPEETLFYDIFCHNCADGQETDQSSLEAFARKVFELGWQVLSVERNHAECPECANFEEPESSYSYQYQAGNGGRLQ